MRVLKRLVLAAAVSLLCLPALAGNPFNEPWRDASRALVIDAYEHNSIDWAKMVTDKRIAAFIAKASDGDGEPWNCAGENVTQEVCRLKFRRYFIAQELYQTRRALAKSMGLKWGSYHLGRKGDPIAQADHYLDFAKPTPDEVMVLDIEGLEDKWMSLEDAETFTRRIHQKTGRYPMLYVNGSTARHIADRRDELRLLSRMQLWYARFSPEIEGHFPKGNWDAYAFWQFSATPNCNARRCPYRVPGTPTDIDVNVADMTVEELRAAWPLGGLIDEKPLPVQPMPVQPMPVQPMPVQPMPDQPMPQNDMLVATAPVQAEAATQALQLTEFVPLPVSAPRETSEKPKVLFVAMANLMGETTMAAPLSVPESLDLLGRVYRAYAAGKPISLVAEAQAEQNAQAGVDPMTTGTIITTRRDTKRIPGLPLAPNDAPPMPVGPAGMPY